uniref:Uncharacterized protein n=1 Tax=Magnetococcus massalia (strain MO-1) TaxID=451514 RepID=A0A1S7LLG8_MAGMO|nr:conserved protein of unknown function [Candidatus Magnetococcus massalia]
MADGDKRLGWFNEGNEELFQYEDYLDAILTPAEEVLISTAQVYDEVSPAFDVIEEAFVKDSKGGPFSSE